MFQRFAFIYSNFYQQWEMMCEYYNVDGVFLNAEHIFVPRWMEFCEQTN